MTFFTSDFQLCTTVHEKVWQIMAGLMQGLTLIKPAKDNTNET
jgi:hypothetical protein